MARGIGLLLVLVALASGGCARLWGERLPRSTASADTRQVTFEVVAQGGRCEPGVLAADREGRALLITFRVKSPGGAHYFLVPEAGIRKQVPAAGELEIPWLADRSGIYEYACASSRWIGPFTPTGKLAVK